MSKKLPFISTLAIAAIFMTAHPAKITKAQEKTVATLSPVGEWSAQAMGADTKNGYCALSRKYSDDLILTLGQNVMEEYSLAIDYQNQKLDMDKAYKVTLQPGPGQIRAYEMMPASQQAMVLRLGYDDSFITSLESSGVLKVQVDGKNNHFQISDFKAAQKKLSECMAGLKGKSEVKVASDFSAEKVENPEPIKIKEQPKEEPKVEFKKAEGPKIVEAPVKVAKEDAKEAETLEITPKVAVAPKVIEIAKVGTKEIEVASNVAEAEAAEKAKKIADAESLKTKIEAEQKLAEAAAKAETESVQAEKEATQKLAAAEVEAQKKAEVEKKALELQKKQADLKKAQELQQAALEKKKQQEEAAKLAKEEQLLKEREIAALEAKKKAEAEAQKLEQEAEAKKLKELAAAEKLKAEEEAKKLVRAEAKALEIKKESDRIAKEKAEKIEQAKEIQIIKEQEVRPIPETPMETAMVVQPDPNAFAERVDVKTQQELKEVQEKLKALEQENRQLYLEARKAQGAIDSAVVETGNQALKKIREYERKLEAAQADNLALSKEMEEMRKLQENGRLDAVSGDTTLEQSTKRYNESEREIRRLGLLLEQQRNAHRAEKQELEQMLFDPAVAEQSQRKRLAELEAKLREAEAKVQQSKASVVQNKAQEKREVEIVTPRVSKVEEQSAITEVKRKEAEITKQKMADLENVRASDLAKQKKLELELARKNQEQLIEKKEADLKIQKQLELAKLTKQKEAELKLKQEQIRLKEMEIKLEQADKKLNAMDDVVEFKVVPSASASAPTIVNLDKRDSETYRTDSGKVSAPPSYSSSRPSAISRQPNNKAVQIEPKTAAVPTVRAVLSKSASISFNDNEIKDVLTRAGVGVNSDISNQGEGRYSWKSGALDGRAQVVPLQRAGSLDQFVQSYIGQAKSSCKGDFASLPATHLASGKGFEIACIGDNQETSSSVIFKQRGSEIVAISHETSANDMDEAMDARDRIAGSL